MPCASFVARQQPHRQLVLAVMKVGFSYQEALEMEELEAEAWLDAWLTLNNPRKGKAKTYKVRRPQKTARKAGS